MKHSTNSDTAQIPTQHTTHIATLCTQISMDPQTPERAIVIARLAPSSPMAEPATAETEDNDDSIFDDLPSHEKFLAMAPASFAHLSSKGSKRTNVAVPWFKAYCMAKELDFDTAIICAQTEGHDMNVNGLSTSQFNACVEWLGEMAGKYVTIPPDCSKPHQRLVTFGTLRTVERWQFNVMNHQLAMAGRSILGSRQPLGSTLPAWPPAETLLKASDKDLAEEKCALSLCPPRQIAFSRCTPDSLSCTPITCAHSKTITKTRGDFALSLDHAKIFEMAKLARSGPEKNPLIQLQVGYCLSAVDAMGELSGQTLLSPPSAC